MSETGKAVFLSYASQDSEAARRIAQALRAEGIEVWFDESALAGGEAWDASIRRQIRDCALFVAIVSANTQGRKEGYFRLEWKLADERSHLIAEGTPFVLPVIIDGTKERDALVPKSFLGVQWTWLPHGEVPPAFVARVQRLLGGEGASPNQIASAPTAPSVRSMAREPRVRIRWMSLLPWALCVGLALVVAWLVRQPDQTRVTEPRYTELALPESAPVAFTGPAPIGIWQRAVAISRDGRTVAYIALKGGTTSLVARRLDTGGAREFPGTEGAFFPFFSPDGQWIGFFVKGDLRKVPVAGGTPSTMAAGIKVPVGAEWSHVDRILVAQDQGHEPVWVSPADRTTTRISNPGAPENYSRSALDPTILPGEEWAIGGFDGFLQLLSLKGAGVHWLSKAGPVGEKDAKPAELLRGWSPRYLKEGFLIFMSGEGTELKAMRFDPAKVRPTGAPFAVLEGIRREQLYTAGQFTLSEEGTFVYALGADAEASELAWVDEQSKREKVPIPPGPYHGLSLSRDGLAAFFRKNATGSFSDLLIFDVATGRQVRSIPHERTSAMSLWGPDGSLFLTPWDTITALIGQHTRRFASAVSDQSTEQPKEFDLLMGISPNGEWMAFTVTRRARPSDPYATPRHRLFPSPPAGGALHSHPTAAGWRSRCMDQSTSKSSCPCPTMAGGLKSPPTRVTSRGGFPMASGSPTSVAGRSWSSISRFGTTGWPPGSRRCSWKDPFPG
jgi:hypothetical protein